MTQEAYEAVLECAKHMQQAMSKVGKPQQEVAEAFAKGIATGIEIRELLDEKKGV